MKNNNNFNNNKDSVNIGGDNSGDIKLDIETLKNFQKNTSKDKVDEIKNADNKEKNTNEYLKLLLEDDVNREYENLEDLQNRLRMIDTRDIAYVLGMEHHDLINWDIGIKGDFKKKAMIIEKAIRDAECSPKKYIENEIKNWATLHMEDKHGNIKTYDFFKEKQVKIIELLFYADDDTLNKINAFLNENIKTKTSK